MLKAFQNQLGHKASQIRQAFKGIVARSAANRLQIKGLAGEVLQDVELVQHVGFSSHIPPTAQVVLLPLNGKTARAIVIGSTAAPVIVVAEEKETLIYDQFGHVFRLTESGAVLNCDLDVQGKITATGDISSDANVTDATGSMQTMRTQYNGHKHGSSPVTDTPME